jgi:hypothetical protein
VQKSRPTSTRNPDRPTRNVQLQLLSYPDRHVSKPRTIFRPFNLGSIGCQEASVTRCITTQNSAHLKEALFRILWRTRFGRDCVPFAKIDNALYDSSKIPPCTDCTCSLAASPPGSATSPSPRQYVLLHMDRTDKSTVHIQC